MRAGLLALMLFIMLGARCPAESAVAATPFPLIAPFAQSAIVGGGIAQGRQFASLAFVHDDRALEVGACTATVVAPDAVLTAAHCAENLGTGAANPASGYVVETDATNLLSQSVESSSVADVIIEPGFRPPESASRDAALLVLTTPTSAPPVRLSRLTARSGTAAVLAGWGVTAYGQESLSPVLHRARALLRSTKWCVRHAREFHVSDELCVTHFPPGIMSATCFGDSGAPLLVAGRGGPIELGLVSRGSPTCAASVPTILTSTQAIDSWVTRTLAKFAAEG
jgi:trypsin